MPRCIIEVEEGCELAGQWPRPRRLVARRQFAPVSPERVTRRSQIKTDREMSYLGVPGAILLGQQLRHCLNELHNVSNHQRQGSSPSMACSSLWLSKSRAGFARPMNTRNKERIVPKLMEFYPRLKDTFSIVAGSAKKEDRHYKDAMSQGTAQEQDLKRPAAIS